MAGDPEVITKLEDLTFRLRDIGPGEKVMAVAADPQTLVKAAQILGLVALEAFCADLRLKPWFDGVEIRADWRAHVVQTCGVSLEAFASDLTGAFLVRVVPPSSPYAPQPSAEVILDLDAEDPPDLLQGDGVDVGAYLLEHLALELDPYPRKPGAAFDPPASEGLASPFDALRNLKI
jgi:hypothetical protein